MTKTIEAKFEAATRTKLRFPYKGLVSTEDLWDLSVQQLDSVFKVLNSELKTVKEESLLNTKTKKDEELDLKIDIVKHVFEIKTAEANARLEEKERKEQKQKILNILASKKEESLQNKSPEELEAMLKDLEA